MLTNYTCLDSCYLPRQSETVLTVSNYLASLIIDCQSDGGIITIIIPEPVDIIKKLLVFLSTGTVVCDAIEDVFAVGKAANILGRY